MSLAINFMPLGNDMIPLKYIKSDGNSWIITDLNADGTDDFTIECDVMFDEKLVSSYFLGTDLAPSGLYVLYIRGNDYLSTQVGKSYGQTNFTYNTGVIYNIKMNLKTVNGNVYKTTWINGILYENNINCNVALAKTYPISLFWVGSDNAKNKIKMKFYSVKTYKDGNLSADLMPCMFQGEPCMYDNQTGKCYYNSGTSPLKYE